MIPANFLNKPLSTSEILSQLSGLNLSEYPILRAHELIAQIGKYPLLVTTIPVDTIILRARVNCEDEVFSNKSQLSYKPAAFNQTFQRASTRNYTMFYGSIYPDGNRFEKNDYRRLIGLCEVSGFHRKPLKNDGEERITYGKWVTKKPIPLVPIIYNFENLPKSNFSTTLEKDFNRLLSNNPKEMIEKAHLIYDFFEREFSKEETTHDYDYLFSAIYTEQITHNLGHKLAGVLYPSVRTKEQRGNGFNVAITPEFIDNKSLELEVVAECTIYKKGDMIFCDNDKEAILSHGQDDFALTPIIDPKVHIGRDLAYKILNKEIKVNVINQ